MKKREPESKAMRDARRKLHAIVGDLRAVKARAVALEHRLRTAVKTAEPVVTTAAGERITGEGWMADEIREWIREALADGIRCVANVARDDRRAEIRKFIRDDDEHAARLARERQRVQEIVTELEGGCTGHALAALRAELRSLTGGEDPRRGRLPGWEVGWAERFGMTPERLSRLRCIQAGAAA
jgi:hypothetical protein